LVEDLLTEQYEDDAAAETGRRVRWGEGWVVRSREWVEVPDSLSMPETVAPPAFFLSLLVWFGFKTLKSRPPRKVVEVV
jgi:hypothetical protein